MSREEYYGSEEDNIAEARAAYGGGSGIGCCGLVSLAFLFLLFIGMCQALFEAAARSGSF